MPSFYSASEKSVDMTKVQDFTQRVSAYQKERQAANRSLDIKILERLVAEMFTLEEQYELGNADRIVTTALNQTRGIT